MELAREHEWRPNSTARALSMSQAGAIGWVVRRTPKSSTIDPYFMDLLIGVQLELSATPYNLVLKLVGDLESELNIYAEWEAERRVDGILLADLEVGDTRSTFLRGHGIPTSAIGSPRDELEESEKPDICIPGQDVAGVHAIVGHLHEVGHRRIGWVAGPSEFVATRRRAEALESWRPEFESVAFANESLDASAISRTAVALQRKDQLTALVVDNELAAIETVAALRASGAVVPRDVSVVSWLGSDLCLLSDPPLTALEHDVTGLGRRWTRALLGVTYPDEVREPEKAVTPVLQVRDSSA